MRNAVLQVPADRFLNVTCIRQLNSECSFTFLYIQNFVNIVYGFSVPSSRCLFHVKFYLTATDIVTLFAYKL